MRLLKLIGPNKFSLVQVPTHNTLPYAILSHTWTHGQEVTYQDLISGVGKRKSGYEKIKFCGEQAAKDGFLYFWVDTCCIDKSNPHELATAINSMFRWYRNAKKCYVYLADVSTPGNESDTQPHQHVWEAAFRKSRWFTRGWTLQELIAPETVEFFSREGKELGNKKSLQEPIHEITNIPIKALQGDPFSDFSISERKEWAAKRQTTEEEDLVYCLIGLCGVSMPLLYGEGKENAMKRLQVAIKEFLQDHNELEDREESHAPFLIPFDRNPNFTSQGTQLSELEEKLSKRDQVTKVAVTGLGGVGKTQLVLELVYRIREKHKNCSIIWIPATNMDSLHQGYLNVAQKLCIPRWEEKKADVKRLVQEHLSKKSAGEWLLVFDNADDINMWIDQSSRLIDYLPRSEHGFIVFTTRDRKAAVKLAHNNVVEVPEMDEIVATSLLQKCLINPDLVENQPDTSALLRELTYLPLAIVQATAYINANRISFSDYLNLLAEQEEDVIDLLSEEFEDNRRYQDAKNPVATTWLISFEQIRYRDPLAADYLSFIACIDSKDIPQSLLPAGPSRKKEIDAFGTLDAYSFIIKRSKDQAIDLHRLVHLATRNWLRKQGLIAQWTEKAIARLEDVFPDNNHQNRSVWRMYLPHVAYTLKSDMIKDIGKTKLLWRFGMCLYSDGRYNEAEKQFFVAFETRKRFLGPEHPDTLISMGNLALIYQEQGRWKEAEDLEVLVMETRKRVLGLEYPETLISMGNLASIYRYQGRWKEAEDLELLVIETRKRVLGLEHLHTLTSMGNLALIYRYQGRWKEAEDLEVLVMETRKRVQGPEHPYTLISTSNLASIYQNQGRWKEAEDLEASVMETRKRVLGPEHPHTLANIGNLASAYQYQGRWEDAENLGVLVVETEKRVLGREHPDTLISINNLASIYQSQSRWKDAGQLQEEQLEICLKILGREHPSTLGSMSNLALTYQNQSQFDAAEELGIKVVETSKTTLGADHPDTLTSMNNLAFTWKSQGRYEEALELMEECVTLRTKIIGPNHPHTLSSRTILLKWQTEHLESCI